MQFSFGQIVYEGRKLYWGTRGHWDELSTEEKASEEAGAIALIKFLDDQRTMHATQLNDKYPHHD